VLLDTLKNNIELERLTKEQQVRNMELDVQQRQEATVRREETTKRRVEIVEEAARMDQAARDAKMFD
jgi:hypothetical protein